MKAQVASLFGIILLIGFVSSTTYYVSIFGSDRNNGLSDKTPFLTLQQCENVAKDGDVIQLLPGVFEGYQNCIEWDKANVTLQGPSSIACAGGISGQNHDMHFKNLSLLSTSNYVSYAQFYNAMYSFNGCFFNLALDIYTASVNITHTHFSGGTSIYHSGGSFYMANSVAEGSGSFTSYSSILEFHNCSFPDWSLTSAEDYVFHSNNSRFSSLSVSYLGSPYYWGYQKLPDNYGECKINGLELTCSSSNFGLQLIQSNCSIHNLQVHSCVASYLEPASGVMFYTSTSNISDAHIFNNFGNSAMYIADDANITLTNCLFEGNQGNATTLGGALHISGVASVIGSTFRDNLAYDGGAFFLANDAVIVLENSSIENNVAYYAGAYDCAPNTEPGSITLINVQITDNTNISGEGDICPSA